MADQFPDLPDGYSRVPAGKLANAVTCLEMREKPSPTPMRAVAGLSLERMIAPDLAFYRRLFRAVGEDWMWVSRLTMSDDELRGIIHDPQVQCHILHDRAQPVGLLEMDFRKDGECEIVYFGLVKDAIGRGAGRFLMDRAVAIAWDQPIRRLWLHTCHFDSPGALPFYQRSGFKPYAFMVEVIDDPRLSGTLPRSAAPHIPLLG